jgi:hypothetical protein
MMLFFFLWSQRCPWRRYRDRRGVGGSVAVGFRKKHRGSDAVAVAFFSRTLKNCMNLVEFQCLQMKHPETK